MNRKQCYMAPMFDDSLKRGTYVYLEKKNSKGRVRQQGYGRITSNTGADICVDLYIDTDVYYSVWLSAKDVYHGKHKLRYIDIHDVDTNGRSLRDVRDGERVYILYGNWSGLVCTDEKGKYVQHGTTEHRLYLDDMEHKYVINVDSEVRLK